jgi:hypothetical protein
MATVHPLRRPEPVEGRSLHLKAMDNLAFIRDTMAAAVSFTAVSGWGMVGVGGVAVVAGLLASIQPTVQRWTVAWVSAAVLAPVIMGWAIYRKSRANRVPLLSGPGRKFVLSFSPPMVVGAILTIALTTYNLTALIPAVWLLLYGTAVVAGGAFSVKIVPVMGVCFMVGGIAALLAPSAWIDGIMIATFGGLHLVFGLLIARRHGG